MNADYSPESLEALDRLVLSQSPEQHRNDIKVMEDRSLPHIWWTYMVPGSYFAEVVIRNLGGR
ncbi:MAG: hypothetical protein KJ672_06775 [Candidatus Thermoplasmatota archaeon]|nr:hypothetical protein [Candidatus Thermoplasmatota archaeon]